MNESLRGRAGAVRTGIKSGALRGSALLEVLLSVPFIERDAWVDEVFGLPELPVDVPHLPRESVPYLPCGVDEILAMVRDVPLRAEDELVDLGSGLGRVLMLAHLLSGAACRGFEIQEPLVLDARARCADLRLPHISFVLADATEADLDGTVFFLYAPFSGEMLTRAIKRIQTVAARHPIVVCTVGLELNDVSWLVARACKTVTLTVYDSR